MFKAVRAVLLFAFLVILWPAVYWLNQITVLGAPTAEALKELALFLPMGFLGACAVTLPNLSPKYTNCLTAGLLGYLVAAPISYLAAIYGSLILPLWLATTVLGSLPLIIFTFIGYKIGEKVYGAQIPTF